MFSITKRIAKLGSALAQAFTERARYYFTEAKSASNTPALTNNYNLMGAVLAEVATVILKVTNDEADSDGNGE